MGGIGFPELLIVLVIIMILFGARKIPDIGSTFGKSIRNFKRSMNDPRDDKISVTEISRQAKGIPAELKAVPELSESSQSDNARHHPDAVSETMNKQ
ncbi:MAG: twin-arginine translocase TatA/TatE family subunit [Nitrospinaceae bacterium]